MRDDFDQKTKDVLFRRARGRCSNPACRKDTSGAHSDPDKAINIGFAAHITAAASGGPRYDPTVSAAQRKATENGIWLCGTCAKLIDSDPQKYTVELLRRWKRRAEADDELEAARVAPVGMPRAVSFMGRVRERGELLDRLRAGASTGIIALAGMGGVGKTALAAEVVAQLSEDVETFPGGASWIPCEDIQGAEGLNEVWTRVARALSLGQVAVMPDPAQRRGALQTALMQGQRRLLALDNVDGLKAEDLLETLAIQGHTALLLTARPKVAPHRLHVLELPPLESPDAQALFLRRLHENDVTRPTAADEAALDGLLALVGGLPLAIELTAAYAGEQGLALSTVQQEVEQAGIRADAFQDLDSPESRRALSACFERSWQKLNARQQRLFASLSLLEGPNFLRSAALALAEASAQEAEQDASSSTPAGDLARLLTYALVERLPEERLRLHSLLRAYAAERLTTLPAIQAERQGAAALTFWLAYAKAHPGYWGMDALEAEAPGLLGALAWAHEHARYQDVLALEVALAQTWRIRGRRDETLRMYAWAVEAAQRLGDVSEQRRTIHQFAVTLADLGQVEEARTCFKQALELAKHQGDLDAERAEVHELAELDRKLDRLADARRGFERTLELARQLSDPEAERLALHHLALLDRDSDRLVQARVGFMRALKITLQMVNQVGIASELRALGFIIGKQGKLEKGRQLIWQALAIDEWLKDTYCVGVDYHFLAQIEEQQGNRSDSITHYHEALHCFEQVQAPDAKEVRAALRKLEEVEGLEASGLVLEYEEAARGTHDAAFLAEKFDVAPDAPDIPAYQEHLSQPLAQVQQPPEVEQVAVVDAVQSFLNARSWQEARSVVEREQALLLSKAASRFLDTLVEQARQANKKDVVASLAIAYALLFLTRESGFDATWLDLQRSDEEQKAEG